MNPLMLCFIVRSGMAACYLVLVVIVSCGNKHIIIILSVYIIYYLLTNRIYVLF